LPFERFDAGTRLGVHAQIHGIYCSVIQITWSSNKKGPGDLHHPTDERALPGISNQITLEVADDRCGSLSPPWPRAGHFRSSPMNRHWAAPVDMSQRCQRATSQAWPEAANFSELLIEMHAYAP